MAPAVATQRGNKGSETNFSSSVDMLMTTTAVVAGRRERAVSSIVSKGVPGILSSLTDRPGAHNEALMFQHPVETCIRRIAAVRRVAGCKVYRQRNSGPGALDCFATRFFAISSSHGWLNLRLSKP